MSNPPTTIILWETTLQVCTFNIPYKMILKHAHCYTTRSSFLPFTTALYFYPNTLKPKTQINNI
jgi:hypothetical protein